MPHLNVVQLDKKPVSDIPGMLRNLADKIEADEYGKVETLFAVMPVDGDYPKVFGWGAIDGKNDPTIQFELAKMWLLTNMVERRT